MTVEFRYANLDEYPRISRYLAEYWAADHIYVREPALFDWTYGRRDLWDRDGYSFALAEEGGEVVGILGAIPFALNRFGGRARALWLAQYMLSPDYRRGSLAVQLLGTMRREPYEATIAFGINPQTAPIYQVLRWRVLENIPRHFVSLPDAIGRMSELIRLAHADWPHERAKSLAAGFTLQPFAKSSFTAANELPEDWDVRWAQIAPTTIGAARDAAYLNWRYRRHPMFEYRFIAANQGLLVWRLETIRLKTETGQEPIDRIGRVVEFLPASRENARELLSALFQQLIEADAVGADFYGYHGESRHWMGEYGFLPIESQADGAALPARFQPLDGKSPAIMSSMFINGDAPACSANSDCAWYWTKSDADQDRPN